MNKVIYILSAILATLINICSQDVVVRFYDGSFSLWISIFTGTGAGLIFKYYVDKRYVFEFHSQNIRHDGRKFLAYAAMGLITTAVFWIFELSFHFLFNESLMMRYIGGAIGLTLGYAAKYHLDRRYIFQKSET